jgi:hypothetical protein
MATIKSLSILILVILMASLVIAQMITTLTGSNVRAIKGATEVPYAIYLNNTEKIAGFQLEISYPSYLIYKRIELGNQMQNATIIINNETTGLLQIASIVENEISPDNDNLFDVIFDISQEAQTGNYTINFPNTILADINTTIISLNIINGSFEIVNLYNVTFLPPISLKENFTLQEGVTLPLKFSVFQDNIFVSDSSVLVRIYNQSLSTDHTYNASGIGNDYIRINSTEEHYITNINTGNLQMPEGIYTIEISFSNFQKKETDFILINKNQGIGKGKNK